MTELGVSVAVNNPLNPDLFKTIDNRYFLSGKSKCHILQTLNHFTLPIAIPKKDKQSLQFEGINPGNLTRNGPGDSYWFNPCNGHENRKIVDLVITCRSSNIYRGNFRIS